MQLIQTTKTIVDVKPRPHSYRFDVFKGVPAGDGKVHKLKTVGSGYLVEGCKTYTIYLKTFLEDVFYLLPEQKKTTNADFIILTREASHSPKRKYFWNNVGEGNLLSGDNAGLLHLSWDMFGASDIYLNLYPKNIEGE